MEKLPEAKSIPENESDEVKSQALEEEFHKLTHFFEQKLQNFRFEIEKLAQQSEDNKHPISSKQIRSLTELATDKLSETFSSLIKDANLKAKIGNCPKSIKENILNVDYKKFKSAKKVKTVLNNITSVIEYIESEQLLVFGGPNLVLILDAFTLEKVTEIMFSNNVLPVLFQYEPITEVLFVCCMGMVAVEAYKFDKEKRKFKLSYELTNHNMPGVASLKLINSGYLLTGGYDRKLSVWNVSERKLVKKIDFNEGVVCFEEVSANILLIGGDRSISVYNITDNAVITSYQVHEKPIWLLIYHAMHQLIISGACDNTVKVSSFKDDGIQILHTFLQTNYSYGVCLLDTEHILTCSKDRILRVYNVLNGKKVQENSEDLEFDGDWITIDPSRKRAFISECNGTVHIFEEKH